MVYARKRRPPKRACVVCHRMLTSFALAGGVSRFANSSNVRSRKLLSVPQLDHHVKQTRPCPPQSTRTTLRPNGVPPSSFLCAAAVIFPQKPSRPLIANCAAIDHLSSLLPSCETAIASAPTVVCLLIVSPFESLLLSPTPDKRSIGQSVRSINPALVILSGLEKKRPGPSRTPSPGPLQEVQFSHGERHRHTPPQVQRPFDLRIFIATAGCAGHLPDVIISRVKTLPRVQNLDHKINHLIVTRSALCDAADGAADRPRCL